MKISGETARQ